MTANILKKAALISILVASTALTGCTSLKRAVGGEKIVPDEFRVVTKAPLVMPPEFNLRPPRPGEARPLELRPDMQARNALFGAQIGAQASAGEVALINQMGAQNADPRIRQVLDEEAGNIAHKDEGFANRILGITGNHATAPGQVEAPLDPEAEAARQRAITNSTGGAKPTIQQNRPGGIKLPGL